jgi:hypothetical protein
MATFAYKLDRRQIFFTDHALDRWWERCQQNGLHGRQQAMTLLRERLGAARWTTEPPAWARLNLWHRACAEGMVVLDDDSGFVVNRNPQPDGSYQRVAVTYITGVKVAAA